MFIDAARAFALRIIYTLGEKEVSIRCVPSAFQKPTSIKKKKKAQSTPYLYHISTFW